jgi:hypothetical protein
MVKNFPNWHTLNDHRTYQNWESNARQERTIAPGHELNGVVSASVTFSAHAEMHVKPLLWAVVIVKFS